jgi:hypothetical protein
MFAARESALKRWGFAWIGLVLALALHVADEALNDFLPLYNQMVEHVRTRYRWFPFPAFTFRLWLGGLIALVVVLLSLSPLVFSGRRWLLGVAYFLGVVMVANAAGHAVGSLYWGTWMPGVYSSPVLFAAAVALLITTRRVQSQSRGPNDA